MIFFIVLLGLTALTSKALVEKGRNCVDMLTGNAFYTIPAGFLASITTACDTLEQANEEVLFFGGVVNQQAKRAAEVALKDLIRQLAGLVQQQSGGDEAKILSAGFQVRRRGKPVNTLATPADLRPIATGNVSEVSLRWRVVADVASYQLFINSVGPDAAGSWEPVGFTSRTAYTVSGLESAKYYWFRVKAIGRKGLESQFSQVAKALAA